MGCAVIFGAATSGWGIVVLGLPASSAHESGKEERDFPVSGHLRFGEYQFALEGDPLLKSS